MNKKKILRAAFFTPADNKGDDTAWGLNLLLWGKPGIGKSQIVKAEAAKWGLTCKVLSPGTDGEGAFGVTPVPEHTEDGKRQIGYPPPHWVHGVDSGGLVFLDEVNQAAPTLQPCIMGIALDRRIGDYVLGPKVRRIAAANPSSISAGGWDLASPVANRFGHIDWEAPDVESWVDWLGGFANPDDVGGSFIDEEKRVLDAWGKHWPKCYGAVTGFVRKRTDLLMNMPDAYSDGASKAWPSPRTWEMATRALTSGFIHELEETDREEFVASFIGRGAAIEFFTYSKKLDLPDPFAILDGKEKFKHNKKRLDRTSAIFQSCLSAILQGGKVKKDVQENRILKFWQILGDKKVMEENMDLSAAIAHKLVDNKMFLNDLSYDEAAKVLTKLSITYNILEKYE